MFHKIIAHGMWGGALISTVLGTQLSGPGAIYLAQSLRFRRVGPEVKIRAAAEVAQIDISQFDKIYTEHSHPAAERAVLMAREHKVEALMKGSLHADELMHLSMLNTGCAPRVA